VLEHKLVVLENNEKNTVRYWRMEEFPTPSPLEKTSVNLLLIDLLPFII
jgi:hypothetical protein